MNKICLAAAALNQTPLAWDTNRQNILAAVGEARDAGAEVLCLPELCISGYGCEDMFFSIGVQQTSLQLLMEIVPETKGLAVCFGLPLVHEGTRYNAVAMAHDGQLLGFTCKQHLAGDGIHYEPRWFQGWPAGEVGTIEIAGGSYPLGDLLFDCGGVQIGLEICRDAWVADRTGAQLAKRGADILLNPSASHFAFAKQKIREKIVLEGSQRFGVGYAYANLLGNESGRSIYDGGTLLAANGQMIARGPRFSFADWVLTTATLDLAEGSAQKTATVQQVAESKEEEFSHAVPLALFDYLRKSGSQGFVISLSGGADSSAVAVLIHLMVQLASRELGLQGFIKKLAHIQSLRGTESKSLSQIVGRLLACVYQSTSHSGEITRHAAQTVAEAIGAEFFQWDIDDLVTGFVSIVSEASGRELSWEQDDLALQNIQARTRGPGAWLLANLRGAILLTTSNRSEAAVGYATMDGDTCGGLAPIAGIDKAFLRDWLQWMESIGPAGIGPLPVLEVVNQQQPTAELRPPSAGQTDEADLMPYPLLDAVERAAIRDKLLPIDVLETVRPQFPQFNVQQLAIWVERFFRLWCQNQWKRERYAPSFHLDDENLDPKTWCRFPILNSGFQHELEELRQYVERLGSNP